MIKPKQISSWVFSRTYSIKVLYNFPCLPCIWPCKWRQRDRKSWVARKKTWFTSTGCKVFPSSCPLQADENTHSYDFHMYWLTKQIYKTVICLWNASDNEVDWHAALHHKTRSVLYQSLDAIRLSTLSQRISEAPCLKYLLLRTKL